MVENLKKSGMLEAALKKQQEEEDERAGGTRAGGNGGKSSGAAGGGEVGGVGGVGGGEDKPKGPSLETFLTKVKMQKFLIGFEEQGVETVDDLSYLEDADYVEMGMKKVQ
jgi:hypothetical protein